MTTHTSPKRRADRRDALAAENAFKPGRGRQLDCLVRPLLRTEGLTKNLVQIGDRDSEIAAVEHVTNHPSIVAIYAFVDAEEASGAASYTWTRSSLLFIYVVSLVLGLNLAQAHRRVPTDPDLRRLGGFQPRPPRADEHRLGDASDEKTDNAFPYRQSVDDFVNRWLGGKKKASADSQASRVRYSEERISERGKRMLLLVEKAMQEIAFENILKFDLDRSRLVHDGSIVLSGHRRDNQRRTDWGAKMFVKNEEEKAVNCRMLGSVQLVGTPFVIFSRLVVPEGESPMAKDVLLPGAAEASRRLSEFAADHGIEDHTGFTGAAVAGDGAFHNHPCIEATFNNGFLPAYNVGGNKKKLEGTRELVDTKPVNSMSSTCATTAHSCARTTLRFLPKSAPRFPARS